MAKKEVKENKIKKHYFKDMKAELKKVIWPTPSQTVNNTVAVIVFTLIIAVVVFVLDVLFDSIYKYGVTPLQNKVQSSYNATKNENTVVDDNNEESDSNENSNENDSNNVDEENNDDSTNIEINANTNSEE